MREISFGNRLLRSYPGQLLRDLRTGGGNETLDVRLSDGDLAIIIAYHRWVVGERLVQNLHGKDLQRPALYRPWLRNLQLALMFEVPTDLQALLVLQRLGCCAALWIDLPLVCNNRKQEYY